MNGSEYTTDIEVRYRDLDAMGHVNNAVYVTYLEHARASYFVDVLDVDIERPGMVVASLSIQYRKPVHLGDEVTVAVETTDIGTSSFTMEYEVRVNGEVAATAESVQVTIDEETGDSRPIPDAYREQIEAFEN